MERFAGRVDTRSCVGSHLARRRGEWGNTPQDSAGTGLVGHLADNHHLRRVWRRQQHGRGRGHPDDRRLDHDLDHRLAQRRVDIQRLVGVIDELVPRSPCKSGAVTPTCGQATNTAPRSRATTSLASATPPPRIQSPPPPAAVTTFPCVTEVEQSPSRNTAREMLGFSASGASSRPRDRPCQCRRAVA